MSENEMTESENVTTMVIDDDDDPVVGVKKNLEAMFGLQDVVDKAFWETRIIADLLDQKNTVCRLQVILLVLLQKEVRNPLSRCHRCGVKTLIFWCWCSSQVAAAMHALFCVCFCENCILDAGCHLTC